MSKVFFLTVGLVCVGLGALGTIVPLLPTTPFVLLAALCLTRGSTRLHSWLIAHRAFGPLIENWQSDRAIAPRAKIIALIGMAATLGLTVLVELPLPILLVQAVVLAAVATFIVSRPTPCRRPHGREKPIAIGNELKPMR